MTTSQKPKINVAAEEHKGYASTVIGDWIVFARVHYDRNAPNPLDSMHEMGREGLGHIYSLNRGHVVFDAPAVEHALKEKRSDAVSLAYFEHGQGAWMPSAGPHPAGVEFQFDGRQFAGAWVPDADVLMTAKIEKYPKGSPERQEFMLARAREACELFNAWWNGQVYGFKVEVYHLLRDNHGNQIVNHMHYDDNVEPEREEYNSWIYGDSDDAHKQAVEAAWEALQELGIKPELTAVTPKL